MDNSPAIDVLGITKRFGDITAVDSVNLTVAKGELFGLVGPNGAGKTTLIRMLSTLIKPSNGTAKVAGYDILKEESMVRRSIGVVPQALTSDLDLTGWENMDIYGKFYEIPPGERKARARELLDIVGLAERAHDLVATYSGGMRRRLEIARGLIHEPPVLILDEPTIGLDPQSRHVIWDLLERLMNDGGLTIVLTTHYMEEAEYLCDRVAIIDFGKIVILDSTENLIRGIPGKDIVVLTLSELKGAITEALGRMPVVHRVITEDDSIRVYVEDGAQAIPALLEEVKRIGGVVESVSLKKQSLEDVFIHYTGRSIRVEAAKKVSLFIGAGAPQR